MADDTVKNPRKLKYILYYCDYYTNNIKCLHCEGVYAEEPPSPHVRSTLEIIHDLPLLLTPPHQLKNPENATSRYRPFFTIDSIQYNKYVMVIIDIKFITIKKLQRAHVRSRRRGRSISRFSGHHDRIRNIFLSHNDVCM